MTDILVIEDEEEIRDLLRRGLTYEGYKVSVAEDGNNGLLMARDAPPDLLEFFLRHPRQVLSAETIYSHVWGTSYDSNVVQVFIRNLRQALGEPDLIHTIRGAGYVLKEAAG